MYDWLPDALQGPSTVITANSRLARLLQQEFAEQQLLAGRLAWPSPAIRSWHGWLDTLLQSAAEPQQLPTRINPQQSQLLWERCLRKALPDSASRLTALVRLSRETWQRLADWQVGISEVARSADNHDRQMFAVAAGHYLAILERNNWVDDAGVAAVVEKLIRSERIGVDGRVTFVGFDRKSPVVKSVIEALIERGCSVQSAPQPARSDSLQLQTFATMDAEMRAAGAWAREKIEDAAESKIAIVAPDLEERAAQKAHRIREGFAPGWQYGPPSVRQFLNVSYGRKLVDYPAIGIALLLLRWLVRDLPAKDVGQLLRTPLIGTAESASRSRMELRLRRLPDRLWSPAMFASAMRVADDDVEGLAWHKIISGIAGQRDSATANASPAEWAVMIDKKLQECGWPGQAPLGSAEFQLCNRWRELLNDLARLDLVSPSMSFKAAIRHLESMAAQTVFQPETKVEAVQFMGPLEASGAEFDAIWISGLTAASWPPTGNPSPLLSRRLQRRFGMPDAEPADTLAYARTLLQRLSCSATEVVCSYALTDDDAEQSCCELLESLGPRRVSSRPDPGWHAAALAGQGRTVVAHDAVPAIQPGESVSGGAATLQKQLEEPVAAFISGRLGVRLLQPQAEGLPAPLRGTIIHDALCNLYEEKPDRQAIGAWGDDETCARIDRAILAAFARHERSTDATLRELFLLERQRVADLLRKLILIELDRDDFSIVDTEQDIAFTDNDVRLQLRADRIDRFGDGSLLVLDYKTGARRKFLRADGRPQEIQLIAYTSALAVPVSAVALVNIDAREVSFDGAGRGFTDESGWQEMLAGWKKIVSDACTALSRGDVRINRSQGVMQARDFNLLSRFTELRRDG